MNVMVIVFTISQLFTLLLFNYLMLFQPLWIYKLALKQSLFLLTVYIYKHIRSRVWNWFAIIHFKLSGIELSDWYFSSEIVFKNLQTWGKANLLVIESIPIFINFDKSIVMTWLSLKPLMDKNCIEFIIARVLTRKLSFDLPFWKINYVRVLKSMHYLFVFVRIVIKLKSF